MDDEPAKLATIPYASGRPPRPDAVQRLMVGLIVFAMIPLGVVVLLLAFASPAPADPRGASRQTLVLFGLGMIGSGVAMAFVTYRKWRRSRHTLLPHSPKSVV